MACFFLFGFFSSSSDAIIARVLSISSLNFHTASFRDDCSIILLLNSCVKLLKIKFFVVSVSSRLVFS